MILGKFKDTISLPWSGLRDNPLMKRWNSVRRGAVRNPIVLGVAVGIGGSAGLLFTGGFGGWLGVLIVFVVIRAFYSLLVAHSIISSHAPQIFEDLRTTPIETRQLLGALLVPYRIGESALLISFLLSWVPVLPAIPLVILTAGLLIQQALVLVPSVSISAYRARALFRTKSLIDCFRFAALDLIMTTAWLLPGIIAAAIAAIPLFIIIYDDTTRQWLYWLAPIIGYCVSWLFYGLLCWYRGRVVRRDSIDEELLRDLLLRSEASR